MKKKAIIFSGITVVLILVVLSFSGCAKVGEKIAEKAIEKAAGGNVDLNLNKDGVTVKDKEGGQTQIGENAKLPDGWPSSECAVYPDLKLSMSTKTKNSDSGKNEFSILGEVTKGSIKDVYNWYKDKYGSGWETITDQYTESNDGDIAFLNFKNDKYEVGIMIGKSGDTASLTMTVVEK
jgi:hypothetical protein